MVWLTTASITEEFFRARVFSGSFHSPVSVVKRVSLGFGPVYQNWRRTAFMRKMKREQALRTRIALS
jgi:hypothetical protein